MAEVDTSSYLRPTLPTQKSTLEVAGELQGLERNSIGIDKAKLDLINQRYDYLLRELNSLPDNATNEDMRKAGLNAVKMKLIPPEMFGELVRQMPPDGNPAATKAYRDTVVGRVLHGREAVNWGYRNPPTMYDNGQTDTPVSVSQREGNILPAGQPIQKQTPINQPQFVPPEKDPETGEVRPGTGVERLTGPQATQVPEGTRQVPGGIPGQYQPIQPNRLPTTSVRPSADPTMTVSPRQVFQEGVPQQPPQRAPAPVTRLPVEQPKPDNFAQRFAGGPTGPIVKPAAGFNAAEEAVGVGSGQDLVEARRRSANYQNDIYPLQQAIPLLESLGDKGVGPGTETINQLKSFVLSNLPGVKASDPGFDKVQDFEKLRKYFTQIVNSSGSTGTNDKLAAAFAGNPSVGISKAASDVLVKSAFALRRMEQAKQIAWEKSGKPANQFSSFITRMSNELDPRAFGFDLMDGDKQRKLLKSLKPDEYEKFRRSIEIAKESGSITPLGVGETGVRR